ncbi:hypothetical protein [Micromonospora noduli]|uniref:hypothetical protein n=1 Tax=Micromonospora noduli TaxID=709876 RepID=UPI000DD9EC24|nr:hypothetical protein [Micromonospora noduli]
MHHEAPRNWIRQAEADAGERTDRPTSEMAEENRRLRREVTLQILAVFICPAPAQHPAVRQHALKPLGEDATKILTSQTKTRLAELFTDWRSDGDAPPSG